MSLLDLINHLHGSEYLQIAMLHQEHFSKSTLSQLTIDQIFVCYKLVPFHHQVVFLQSYMLLASPWPILA